LITLNEELTKLKENCEEEAKHIGYLEGELKNFREREGQYIQQIDQLEEKQDLAKSKYTRLEKDKTDLNDEL
jgi:chromosome segregation ATPase